MGELNDSANAAEGTAAAQEQNNQDVMKRLQGFAQELGNRIAGLAQDITNLEVVTTVGSKPEEMAYSGVRQKRLTVHDPDGTSREVRQLILSQERVVARTIIQLDGDIIMRLPDPNETGFEQYMDVHQKNTEIALENWRTFILGLIEVATSIGRFVGLA